jgi:hypothetical protein
MRDYPYNEMTEKYWFNDADSLYKEEKRFDWYRPNIVNLSCGDANHIV